MTATPEDKIRALRLWNGPIDIAPLAGGITNRNYLVCHGGRRFVVRIGADVAVHHISRANELAASRAAHAAGISPGVVHHEPGVLVLDHVEGRPLTAEDVRDPRMLSRILTLVRRTHREIPKYFRGPAAIFWVFHVVRDYAALLVAADSRHKTLIPVLIEKAEALEKEAGPFEIVFGHNDLLANNFLDDGKRLWLIDWDYAGFNTPLFDLGGLASNNELGVAQEKGMLEAYFEVPVPQGLWRRYRAMKAASLMRESMWSMVSEIHSTVEFDYAVYTADNLGRFDRAWEDFCNIEARP
jgi:thiamine kinase-like enzyme